MKVSKRLLLNSFFVLGGLVLFQPAQVNAATTTQPVKQAAGKSKAKPSKQLTVEEAQRAVNQAKASLDKAVQAVTDAQNKVNSATSGHATAKEISDQQAVVEKAKNNIKDLEAAVKNDGNSVTSQKAVEAAAQKALNAAQNEQKELQKDVATLSEQIKGDQAKLQGADSKAKAQEALTQANKALGDNQASQAKLQGLVKDLTTQLTSAKQNSQTAQSEVNSQAAAVKSKQEGLAEAQAKLASLKEPQISLPDGLNAQLLDTVWKDQQVQSPNTQETDKLKKDEQLLKDAASTGQQINQFVPSKADESIQITPNDSAQQLLLTKFVVNLLNPIRQSLGYAPLTITTGAMKFTQDIIDKYNEANWRTLDHKGGHYFDGINEEAKDNGLAFIPFPNSKGQYYESAMSPVFASDGSGALAKESLADVKETIYQSICRMLFDDSGSYFGHLMDLVGTNQTEDYNGKQQNYQNVVFGFGIDNLGQLHFERCLLMHQDRLC